MSFSGQILRNLNRWFGWFLVISILLIALLTVAVRQLLPAVTEYRSEIETYLSERMRTEVSIGDIHASWEGRFPTLLIQDVKIADHRSRNIGQIEVDQIVLGLNPVASLFRWQPVMSRVEIWSLHTRVDFISLPKPRAKSEADSGESSSGEQDDPLAALWLQPHIFFYDTRLDLALPSGAEVELQSQTINLENSSTQHHFSGELLVSYGDKHAAATLKIESDSYRFEPEITNFDLYLKLSGIEDELLDLAREVYPFPKKVEQLALNTEIWGSWSGGRWRKVFGTLESDRFQLSADVVATEHPILVQDLATDFALLQPEKGHFQLQINDLTTLVSEQPLLISQLVVDRVQGEVNKLSMDSLDVQQLYDFVMAQPQLPESVADVLERVSPRGEVFNLNVHWPHRQKTNWQDLKLSADLEQVGFNAAYGTPAMDGINGLLELSYSDDGLSGQIDLESKNLGLHFPEVFDQGWTFDDATGITHFSVKENTLHLKSEFVELTKPGINASGRWSLYLPLTREIQSELTLLIGLKGSDGRLAPELIPDHEINPGIKKWVSASVKQGHLNQGGFMLHTGTRSIPSRQSPTVQMFLDIVDAEVNYQSGWPAVTDASTSLFLRDQGLAISIADGQIQNSEIEHGWVYLPPGADQLKIVSSITGDSSDVVKTLLDSPIISDNNRELASWQLSGSSHTQLNLNIPLQGGDPTIDVSSDFADLDLVSVSRNLRVEKLAGQISYQSGKGLYSGPLSGTFFGHPLSGKISTKGAGANEKINIALNSEITFNQLREWSGIGMLALASGKQPYRADLDICLRADCSGLTIRTDLKQSRLDLIEPYRKAKGEKLPLLLHDDFGSGTINIALGDKLRAWLKLEKEQLVAGTLSLGGAEASTAISEGFYISGSIPRLDYEQLDAMLLQGGIITSADQPDIESTASVGIPVQADLEIAQLVWSDLTLPAVRANLERGDNNWLLSLNSSDLNGRITLPDSNLPLKAEFAYLNLDPLISDEDESEQAIPESPEEYDQPGGLPDLDIRIDDLVLKEKRWGQWQFSIRSRDQHSYVEQIRGRLPDLDISGDIAWQPGIIPSSHMNLTLKAKDLGRSLTSAGFDQVLETDKFNAQLALNWPGGPWEYALDKSSGSARFTARDGRLLEAGAGTGFLRVFGILNMNALGRRLKLDFADLFAKGVAFDKMEGDYTISEGVAVTNEPFVLRGPSLDMAMSGEIDLAKETVDKKMAVTLPVTDNIPLAAVLLGAPQVAGVAFLLDKLIGDEVKKEIATVTYTMQGDWSDPRVELLQQGGDQVEPAVEDSSIPKG